MTQQAKLLWSLGAALVLAAALGLYAYFGVFEREQAEIAAKESESKLFSLDPEAVTRLEVSAKGETTALEKKEGRWWIVSPLSARADDDAVRRMLSDLERARHLRVVQEEGEMRQFGLEPPSVRVEAKTADGTSAHVSLGLRNTFDSTYYASNRPGRVVAASSALLYALEKTTFDLRDKKLVPWELSEVERFAVEKATRLEVARADGGWKILAPKEERADDKEVEDVVRKLLDLRAKAFPKREVQELGTPYATLVLSGRDGDTRTLRFWKEGDKAYAQPTGGDLAEIDTSSLEPLDKDAEALRDRRIAPFDTETIARIEVQTRDEKFTLVRQDGEWSITERETPEGGASQAPSPAKRWKVNAGLTNLSRLNPEEILPAERAAEHGLEPPARTVRIYDAEGAPVGVYHFGNETSDHAFVRVEGHEGVLKVRARSIFNVPRNLAEVEEPPKEE